MQGPTGISVPSPIDEALRDLTPQQIIRFPCANLGNNNLIIRVIVILSKEVVSDFFIPRTGMNVFSSLLN